MGRVRVRSNLTQSQFNPIQLKPNFWLRASAGVEKNASDEITALRDQSFFGNDGIAPALQKPIYLNSGVNTRPGVLFTGTERLAFSSTVSCRTLVVVGIKDPVNQASAVFTNDSDASIYLNFPNSDATGPPICRAGGSITGAPDYTAGDTATLIASLDTPDLTMYNGAAAGSATNDQTETFFEIDAIGNSVLASQFNLNGVIGELLGFEALLTANERAQLLNYFDTFYS